jgi:rfaE bifunctional protein kinase chain/domain
MKAEGGRRKKEKPAGRGRSSFILHPSSLREARVLVVGDAMLDRYWFGEVERISPEAPVPIVRIAREEERAGGPANVARNAAALGSRLEDLLKRERIDARLHRDRNVKTTVKLRVIGGRNQQLLRVDFETAPGHEVLASKLRDFERVLDNTDVVVLSDYGKGGLEHIVRMIRIARRAGKTVLVDPKGDDYRRYRGASILTPNRAEFRQVVGQWDGEREFSQRAQDLREKLRIDALLVTRGDEGMSLFEKRTRFDVKAQAREVSDVSGAGDTVIATLAVALAGGARMRDAVRLANRAAGIVVGKFGTAVVTPEELFAQGN